MTVEALVLATAYLQQICSSMNSRARNRSSYRYHAITAFLSHGFFLMSMTSIMGEMLEAEGRPWLLGLCYVVAGGAGSLSGTMVSVRLEKLFGAEIN